MIAISVLYFAYVVGFTKARLLPYSFASYNDLLDYREARFYALDQTAIESLGEVFMQHSVNDTLGLCLLHNHFHLLPGEIMVEVVNDNYSTTGPRTIDWDFASSRSEAEDIVPNMMGLTSSGDLIPYEFLDLKSSNFADFTNVTVSNVNRVYSRLASFDVFLGVLAAKLDFLSLRHVFGVCIRHRESITAADPRQSSLETNNPKQRWLRVDPLIAHAENMTIINAKWKRGEATSTFWSFPLKCNFCGVEAYDGQICAECGCSTHICAECGCSL